MFTKPENLPKTSQTDSFDATTMPDNLIGHVVRMNLNTSSIAGTYHGRTKHFDEPAISVGDATIPNRNILSLEFDPSWEQVTVDIASIQKGGIVRTKDGLQGEVLFIQLNNENKDRVDSGVGLSAEDIEIVGVKLGLKHVHWMPLELLE